MQPLGLAARAWRTDQTNSGAYVLVCKVIVKQASTVHERNRHGADGGCVKTLAFKDGSWQQIASGCGARFPSRVAVVQLKETVSHVSPQLLPVLPRMD